MNRDDIERIAADAGIVVIGEATLKLCELVAAAEREACEKVCDDRSKSTFWLRHPAYEEAEMCAAAIRARGEK
jgi:hypothetical protein